MQTRMPSTATIELEREDRPRGRWRTRTSVDERSAVPPIYSSEPEVRWTPQPYKAAPCTCDEGICDRDHENE